MDNSGILADLQELLNVGYVTDLCIIETPKGQLKIEMKTLSPLEEAESYDEVRKINDIGENQKVLETSYSMLARSISSINGVAFENFPQAQGLTPTEKKRFILRKLSDNVLKQLWDKYSELQQKVLIDNTKEEDEALKK